MALYHYSKVLMITLKVFTSLFELLYNVNLLEETNVQPLYKDKRLRPRCGLSSEVSL